MKLYGGLGTVTGVRFGFSEAGSRQVVNGVIYVYFERILPLTVSFILLQQS